MHKGSDCHGDALELGSLRLKPRLLGDHTGLLERILLALGLALVAEELRVHLYRQRRGEQTAPELWAALSTATTAGGIAAAEPPASQHGHRQPRAAAATEDTPTTTNNQRPPCSALPAAPVSQLLAPKLGAPRRQPQAGRAVADGCALVTHPLGGDPPHAGRLAEAVSVGLVGLVVVGVVLRLGHPALLL